MRQLSELVSQVKDEQGYIVVRERTHRNTAESTNARVKWWSIFQLIVLGAEGVFQVWWLKRFFEVSSGAILALCALTDRCNRSSVWCKDATLGEVGIIIVLLDWRSMRAWRIGKVGAALHTQHLRAFNVVEETPASSFSLPVPGTSIRDPRSTVWCNSEIKPASWCGHLHIIIKLIHHKEPCTTFYANTRNPHESCPGD